MSKSSKNEPNSFFLSFIGEYVQVISSFNFSQADESNGVASMPLIVEGFILDADEKYIYMGQDDMGGIRQAIKQDYVVFVQILEQEDEMEKIFSQLPNVKKRDMN